MSEIRIEAADGFQGRFPLVKDRVTIGRSRESDIFLPDLGLSRHHAEILQKTEGFVLRDLGSMNGTRVNGERIQGERPLHAGDVITLAQYALTFFDGQIQSEAHVDGMQAFPARDISDLGTQSGISQAELARRQETLAILTKASSALLVPRPLPELYELVLDQLFQALNAQRGAVVLIDGDAPGAVVVASRSRQGPPIDGVSRAIVRQVSEDRVSLLIPKVLEDPVFAHRESMRSAGIRSAMCASLWIKGPQPADDTVLGLVYLDTLQNQTSFTREDLRILTALSNLAASRIESTRLKADMIEKRRLEDDLRRAAEIQAGLLPTDVPVVPGYQVVGCHRTGSAVGADYYDFLPDRGRLLLALGDVAGKGTGAALLMSLLRTAVRAQWTDHPPAEAAAWINRTLCQSVPDNRYATLFLGSLEPETGRLTYANAGHHPPLLIRSDGHAERLRDGGTILGMFPASRYAEGAVALDAGDTLLVFSDGVARPRAGPGRPSVRADCWRWHATSALWRPPHFRRPSCESSPSTPARRRPATTER